MPKAIRRPDGLVLDAALQYAGRGWHVFPARFKLVGDKWQKLSWKSAKTSNGQRWGATADPDEIRRDFASASRSAIGIPTGAASGFFVVEADTLEGHDVDGIASLRKLETNNDPLPATLIAASPSGSLHHYFKYPTDVAIKNSTGKLAPGVDVKGDGGMVIAPPSKRPGKGMYQWLNQLPLAEAPAWLLERISGDENATDAQQDGNGRGLVAERELVIAAVAVIPNTQEVDRTDWIKVGLAIHGATGGEGLDIFDTWSKRHTTYNATDTLDAWKSFRPKEIGAGTLFHLANEAWNNWRDDPGATDTIRNFALSLPERPGEVRAAPAAPQPAPSMNGAAGPHQQSNNRAPPPPSQSVTTPQRASGKFTRRTGNGRANQDEPEFEIELLNGAGLTPRKQEWLWPGRIPRGTLSLLIGLPDMGKSHIFIDICARVTTGASMPPSSEPPIYRPQSALIVCTEDRVEYTLVPRLIAAGADMSRINFLRYLRSKGNERRGLDLTQDVQRIEKCLNDNPEISLIVFDPISEFLGAKIDGHSNTAVRAVLGQLMDLLDQRNIAALGVSHLPKVKTGAVQTASIGSIGFSACARSSLLVVDEEEDVVGEDGEPTGERELTGSKLLTVAKGNLAAPKGRETLKLKLEPKTLDHPHDEITVARVKWEGVKEVTARELWQDTKPKQQQAKQRVAAADFIKNAMRDPKDRTEFRDRLATEIEAEAEAAGISERTLRRAKKELGIESVQRKGSADWWWVIPVGCDWGPDY